MTIILLVLMLAIQTVSAQSETLTTFGGTVRGVVINSATGSPVSMAAVELRPASSSALNPLVSAEQVSDLYRTESDSKGHFEFTNLPVGAYQAFPSKNGFGSTPPERRADPIFLHRIRVDLNRPVSDVVLKLTPVGVVAGRISDSDGDPVGGVTVVAMQFEYIQNERLLQTRSVTRTDDRGDYRLYRLFPGSYYIVAKKASDNRIDNHDQTRLPLDDAATYFPNAVEVSLAAAVVISPGEEKPGVNIQLQTQPMYAVRGEFSFPGAMSPNSTAVSMSIERIPRDGAFRPEVIRIQRNNYEAQKLTAGTYLITARMTSPTAGQLIGRRIVEVRDGDVDGANLLLSTGFNITGTIQIEGKTPLPFSSLHVRLEPIGQSGAIVFGKIAKNGSFTVPNTPQGTFRVKVTGPSLAYVTSVRVDDRDLSGKPLDLMQGPPARIDISVSGDGLRVAGRVVDSAGRPLENAYVAMIQTDPRGRSPEIRAVRSGVSGAFTLSDAIPGNYRLVAWEDAPYGDLSDADFVRTVQAFSADVSPGGKDSDAQIILTAVPAIKISPITP